MLKIHNGDVVRYISGIYGIVIKCEDEFYHVITEKSEGEFWHNELCEMISCGNVKLWNALDTLIYELKATKKRREELEKEEYE